ncbi:MAG TPA: hypothetical protein VHX16_13525 [Chloroflexota bacterium]|nr:hypothetical protein [Chloroflexota bacterium]
MLLPSAYRLGLSLSLSLVLAWLALPGIGRADDDDDDKKKNNNETQQSTSKNKKNTSSRPDAPDLEVTGLTLLTNSLGQVSDREVMFRVVNIGTDDAPATTARVEITGPVVNVTGSTSAVVRSVPVPALKADGNPFYATAELPGICDGHIVKVSVDLKGDAAAGNNSVGPTKVCPEKPPAPQGQSSGGPAGTLDEARRQGSGLSLPNPGQQNTVDYGDAPDPRPEYLRPGAHTLTLGASGSRVVQQLHRTGNFYLCDASGGPSGLRVGFNRANFTDANDCQLNWVYQTALRFDLSALREASGKLVVGRADLTWDDRWTTAGELYVIIVRQEGPDDVTYSCVDELGRPTVDWSSANALIPHDAYLDGGMVNRWNITNLALDWLRDPAAEHLGVLLVGPDESLDAEDSSDKCYSEILNPRLVVDYTILP